MIFFRYRRSGNKKNIEYSKIIFACVIAFTLGVTVFSCVLMWRIDDASALAFLIPAAFAELSIATGFYYDKARKENEIKLKYIYGIGTTESE